MATTKITTPELFDFSDLNTALQLPSGNTASRPSAPSDGEWRFNTEEKYVEYYDSGTTAWYQIDTEAIPNPDDFPSQNFNVSTYVGTGAALTLDAKFDQAAVLNGSNSSIDFTPNNPVIFPNTGGTLSFWIKPNSFSASSDIIVTSPNGGWGTPYGQIIRLATSGKMELYQYNTTGGNALHDNPLRTSALTVGVWTHVALSYEGNSINDTIQFYTNGSPDGSTYLDAASPMGNSSYNLQVRIGYRNDAGIQNPYDGAIDQVRIYDSKLTDADVSNLYSNETATTASSLNFPSGKTAIATYQFNGNAADVSGTYGGVTTNIGYTGLLFQPDFVWLKDRTTNNWNGLFDSVRGAQNLMYSNANSSGSVPTPLWMNTFNSNGFTIGVNSMINTDGNKYVGWCWKCGGAPTATNSASSGAMTTDSVSLDGVLQSAYTPSGSPDIYPKGMSINTEAGFSIVTYQTNGNNSSRVPHGLGVTPKVVLIKKYSTTGSWHFMTTAIDGTFDDLILDSDAQANNSSLTAPNDDTFAAESGAVSDLMVCYSFAEVDKYQKFGTYTGNNSTNGPIVNTGFEIAFLMIKRSDGTGSWTILDNKRSPVNPRNKALFAELTDQETTYGGVDFFSNGFQITAPQNNVNGGTYLYWAIAANVESAPTLAKSFSTDQWTGTSAIQNVYSSIAPNFIWTKNKGSLTSYYLFDSVRTAGNEIYSDLTNSQYYDANTLTSFNPNGFSLGTGTGVNNSGQNYIAWNWKATELPAINTDGSITSLTSVNDAAGFSIVKFTSTGAASVVSTGHGLSAEPELVIFKNMDNTSFWLTYVSAVGDNGYLQLQTDDAITPFTPFFDMTSTTIAVRQSSLASAGEECIAYCFKSISGYSKVGSYTGNGTSKILYTTDDGTSGGANPFQPDFVLVKRTDSTADWVIVDSVRGVNQELYANLQNQDNTDYNGVQSFNSNGFTVGSGSNFNTNTGEYIYLAIKFN